MNIHVIFVDIRWTITPCNPIGPFIGEELHDEFKVAFEEFPESFDDTELVEYPRAE